MHPKDTDEMANSAHPYQTAPALLGQTYLFQYEDFICPSIKTLCGNVLFSFSEDSNITIADLPEIGSGEHREIWQQRIREVGFR